MMHLMCMCVCVCTYACMHVCACMRVHACVYARVHAQYFGWLGNIEIFYVTVYCGKDITIYRGIFIWLTY